MRLVRKPRWIAATAVLVLSPLWMLPFYSLPIGAVAAIAIAVNVIAAWTGFRAAIEVHEYTVTTG